MTAEYTCYVTMSDQFKAGHVRSMVFWLADRLQRLPARTMQEKYALQCTVNLARHEMSIRCGPVLPEHRRLAAAKSLQIFLQFYQALSFDALANDRLAFKMRPKWHLLCHLQESLQFSNENIKIFEVWSDEDHMGEVSRLFRRCHPMTMLKTGLQRHLVFLDQEFSTFNSNRT